MGLRYLIFYSQQTITFSKSTTETEKWIATCLKLTIRTVQCLQNLPRVSHVETTWKRSFPCSFNAEYMWCVCWHHCGVWTYFTSILYLYFTYSFYCLLWTGKYFLGWLSIPIQKQKSIDPLKYPFCCMFCVVKITNIVRDQ